MEYADLYADVLEQVPAHRRAALDQIMTEYGASETFRFLLAVTACANRREWQLVRIFLRELERADQESGQNDA